jgi:N-acyl-D-amino-acid deacylase
MPISLVIRGGQVYDGSGGPARVADVAVDGDRIVAVGDVPAHADADVFDATGMAVAPGFINVLSHAWGSLQTEPRGPSDLLQGVTTEVFGEAFSLGPTPPGLAQVAETFNLLPDGARADFDRLSEGLGHLESRGVAPNVASFVGGHNLRVLGGGFDDGPLSAAALDRVRGVLEEEMADGALGIGTALIYPPGCYATTEELVAACEVVGRHDGLYISHMRSEGAQFLECLDELIEIGRRASVRAECYHLKAAGRSNWPKMKLAIERIAAARDAGQPVSADMYPYIAGGTGLSACVPPAFAVGGLDALAQRLRDPDERKRIAAAIRTPSTDWENLYLDAGGDGILIVGSTGADRSFDGRRLSDIAAERHADEVDTLLDLLTLDLTFSAIYFMMDEENVRLGLQQPWVSIGSDAEAPALEPPWTEQPTHPRTYGTFARVLGRYSRDEGLFSLSEAIRRMTSQPADTLRLTGRGRLTADAFADIVVFDPDGVQDHATYEQPHQYSSGVRHVLVNGQAVVRDGKLTGALPGRRLRRGRG